MMRIAYFISPHGFGHAARASAVMNALLERDPSFEFNIYTHVPFWFFEQSLTGHFKYNDIITDIGVIQSSPMDEDLPETLIQLSKFIPYKTELINLTVDQLQCEKVQLVICDISPQGIAVAKSAGIPSLLIENFTWDWIYSGYLDQAPAFSPYIDYLASFFRQCDYHIQTEPICEVDKNFSLVTNPTSRKPKLSRMKTRQLLGISEDASAVLVSMGGIRPQYDFLKHLVNTGSVYLVIPGGSTQVEKHDHMILLPHHSDFYHPDLVNACDAIIGKAGYSTISEAYYAGIPYGYIVRTQFRESARLVQFIQAEMHGFEISTGQFESGDWVKSIPRLLSLPRIKRDVTNGSDQIAEWIIAHFLKER